MDELLEAVRELYYAGVWECKSLPLDEQIRLWTNVRDAAGFEPGKSPKEMSQLRCKNCGVEIKECGMTECTHGGYVHLSDTSHCCDLTGQIYAEPLAPAQAAPAQSCPHLHVDVANICRDCNYMLVEAEAPRGDQNAQSPVCGACSGALTVTPTRMWCSNPLCSAQFQPIYTRLEARGEQPIDIERADWLPTAKKLAELLKQTYNVEIHPIKLQLFLEREVEAMQSKTQPNREG